MKIINFRKTIKLDDGSLITLRTLESYKEYHQAITLQRMVWGEETIAGFSGVVLGVNKRIGGISAGAFDHNGALVGFIISMVGYIEERFAQWSFRLGIHPEYRNQGIGYELKEFQRLACENMNVDYIYWSYDPLVSRNAYFNLAKLGAEVHEFVTDMYKGSDSPLHSFLPTHRFIVKWDVKNPSRRPFLTRKDVETVPELTEVTPSFKGDTFKLSIPRDIISLKETDAERAIGYSDKVKSVVLHYINDYYVENFVQDRSDEDRFYIFKRKPEA